MKRNSIFSAIILICILMLTSSFITRTTKKINTNKLKTVVIDAGHGGHDVGCIGYTKKHEKDIALAIALNLGKLIEANMPDVKVIYTRKTDVFVELVNRAKIANDAKADLFISIHCNANKNKEAYGSETYAMGLHVTESNLAVAKRENSVILLEDNFEKNYDGFDPNSAEAYIIFSLYQNKNLDKSLTLAASIEDQFENSADRYSRGVKQAGFLVLRQTTMPSLLIETGFLTNKADEVLLNSQDGQDKIAQSIFVAMRNYKIDIEKKVK